MKRIGDTFRGNGFLFNVSKLPDNKCHVFVGKQDMPITSYCGQRVYETADATQPVGDDNFCEECELYIRSLEVEKEKKVT